MRLLFIILAFVSLSAEGQILNASAPYRVRASGCATKLLDAYSGAAAAYSLRKLDADYAGSAIRVRRSSDNTEQDIGFVGCGDLDTASLKTFVGTGGTDDGFVTTWYDQSSNSRNATQTTSGNQPQIMDNGVVLRTNTLPTVSFGTQSNEWFFVLPTGFLNAQTELTWLGVLKITDVGNAAVFGPSTTFSAGLEILDETGNGTALRLNSATRRNNSTDAAYRLWPNDTQCLTEVYGDASSVSAYRNNTAVTLTDASAMPSLNFNGVYSIGTYYNSTYDISGSIQEMVIYYSTQSSSRTGIASNINTYYTIY